MNASQKIINNIKSEIEFHKSNASYNRGRIFSRAKYIYNNSICSWSEAMIQSWDEAKKSVAKSREAVKLHTSRLAKRFHVDFSPEYYSNQIFKSMSIATKQGVNVNR